MSALRLRPDVLVLGAGGALGEAWMAGVLAGLEDASGLDLRDCDYYVGTSAGAIVASRLIAGQRLPRPRPAGEPPLRPLETEPPETEPPETEPPETEPPESGQAPPTVEPTGARAAARAAARRAGAYSISLSSAFAPLMLELGAPGGAAVRGAVLRAWPKPSATLSALRDDVDGWGAKFDGRLRVVAVRRSSGRRVVFGAPGAPDADVGAAVEASCSVPWLFAPVVIGGDEYVDGGMWSATNIDVAPAGRDAHVLCLIPTAGLAGNARLVAVRNAARSAALIESLVLRRRGAAVQTVSPDRPSAAAIGVDLMAADRRETARAGGYRQGLALADDARAGGAGATTPA